jgi:hypothetical protein
LTGGAAYYFTGGSKATGGYPYYYSGGAKASGGSYYYAGGTKATGGYTYSYAGGAKASGGSSYSYAGGTKATGGYTYSYAGGAKASGGSSYSYAGGAKASGGSSYSYAGGTKATGGATGTGGTRPTGAMKIGTDGYVSMAAGMYLLHGYVGSFEGGSGSSNQLTYGTNNICASGIVASNPNYISYAGIGINVNQNSASSTNPSTGSLAIDATNITVSFSNDYQSQLRLQLNDSAGNNWCYDITGYSSPVTIPLSSFNTRCWDNSGDPFKPGTAITSLSLVVPGDATSDRKFSFCFYSVYFS